MQTKNGRAICGDSLDVMKSLPDESINLCVTSPPYDLTVPREYGNHKGREYIDWLLPFCIEIKRLLKPDGSFVLNIGSGWEKGRPVKKITHYRVMMSLIDEIGFHLAQDIFWHNPAALPSAYAASNRNRLVNAVESIWWFGKEENPKADVNKVLKPYSQSMLRDLKMKRERIRHSPSGHSIGKSMLIDHGGSIPFNFIFIANTSSNDSYNDLCRKQNIDLHPAKFPSSLPEFFIRFLTDEGDCVLDPFAGSLTTGAVAERLNRKWICIEKDEKYIQGGKFRFEKNYMPDYKKIYEITHPGYLWNDRQEDLL